MLLQIKKKLKLIKTKATNTIQTMNQNLNLFTMSPGYITGLAQTDGSKNKKAVVQLSIKPKLEIIFLFNLFLKFQLI